MSEYQDETMSGVFQSVADEVAQTRMEVEYEPTTPPSLCFSCSPSPSPPASPWCSRSPSPAPPSSIEPHFGSEGARDGSLAGDKGKHDDDDDNGDVDMEMGNSPTENNRVDDDFDINDYNYPFVRQTLDPDDDVVQGVKLDWLRGGEAVRPELKEIRSIVEAWVANCEAEQARFATPDGSCRNPIDVDNWVPNRSTTEQARPAAPGASSSNPINVDNWIPNQTTDSTPSSHRDEQTGGLACGTQFILGANPVVNQPLNAANQPPTTADQQLINTTNQQANTTVQHSTVIFTLTALPPIRAPAWLSEALFFLSMVPQNAMGWLSVVPNNDRIFEIRAETSLWQQDVKHCNDEGMDWRFFFVDCQERLSSITDPAVHRLFSLVLIVTCNLAIANGCPEELARDTVRAVLTEQELILDGADNNSEEEALSEIGSDAWDLTDREIDQRLKASIMAIPLYREAVAFLGPKGVELALHVDAIPLILTMDLECLDYIYYHWKTVIPKPDGECAELNSAWLSIQDLVCNLLNSTSEGRVWKCQDIIDAFHSEWSRQYQDDYRPYISCERW